MTLKESPSTIDASVKLSGNAYHYCMITKIHHKILKDCVEKL